MTDMNKQKKKVKKNHEEQKGEEYDEKREKQ
jgi:hypothetical protein